MFATEKDLGDIFSRWPGLMNGEMLPGTLCIGVNMGVGERLDDS